MKKLVWDTLEGSKANSRIGEWINWFLIALITLNVFAAIISTVQSVYEEYGFYLEIFEILSVIIFSIEYLFRLFSCTASVKYSGPVLGRIKFIFSPMSIIDLISIIPFYIPFMTADLRTVRALRLLRILRILKIGRYSESLQLFSNVFKEKKEELSITIFVTFILIIISSSLMYFIEGHAQPDKFPDIPSTMWWAIATLTTVGYGDVFPITPLGKLIGGFVAMLGIGLFALPTSILGAGFVEAIQNKKKGKGE